jgi:hypothetical protein
MHIKNTRVIHHPRFIPLFLCDPNKGNVRMIYFLSPHFPSPERTSVLKAFYDTLLLIDTGTFAQVKLVMLFNILYYSVSASLDHSLFIELPGKGMHPEMIYYLLICLLKDGPIYLD